MKTIKRNLKKLWQREFIYAHRVCTPQDVGASTQKSIEKKLDTLCAAENIQAGAKGKYFHENIDKKYAKPNLGPRHPLRPSENFESLIWGMLCPKSKRERFPLPTRAETGQLSERGTELGIEIKRCRNFQTKTIPGGRARTLVTLDFTPGSLENLVSHESVVIAGQKRPEYITGQISAGSISAILATGYVSA
jgi:hypothetical protein